MGAYGETDVLRVPNEHGTTGCYLKFLVFLLLPLARFFTLVKVPGKSCV